MYHQGEQHPEKDFWIQKGLASYPQTKYEEVPLSKIIIGTQIVPLGLVKVRTNIPPRVTKNKFNEYLVTDGRHRLFNFYLEHFPLPHEIKVGCLVEFRPADGHYSGYNIWQAAELLHLNPRRSISRRFFNYFGLFRKDYSFFAIDDQTRKDLNHRTKVLLEAVEDELDHLYQDFIKRICEFIMVIRENEKKPQLVKKQFAQYQVLLLRLVNEEKEEESLLNKLLQALKDELSKPQLQDNKQLIATIKILEGDQKQKGLIDILKNQQRIIKTGVIPNTEEFERELIRELQLAKSILQNRRDRLYNQLQELLRYET